MSLLLLSVGCDFPCPHQNLKSRIPETRSFDQQQQINQSEDRHYIARHNVAIAKSTHYSVYFEAIISYVETFLLMCLDKYFFRFFLQYSCILLFLSVHQ